MINDWNEMSQKVVRDDPDGKKGRVVSDEMSWYEMFWREKSQIRFSWAELTQGRSDPESLQLQL